ncbi:MAG: hypothetical protein ACREQE_06835 [Candidatus Binataceae bacterium]
MASSVRLAQPRLRSSFIYLANAVSDLRGNWATLALVLAPLVIVASLGLLPDALNLQHDLAVKFAPGARNVAWLPTQVPYLPSVHNVAPLFPPWALDIFHFILLVLTFAVALVVLCAVRRIQSGGQRKPALDEAVAIYREAGRLVPAFAWIVLLQIIVPAFALALLRLDFSVSATWMIIVIYFIQVVVLVFAGLVFLWLFFAQYALVFDGRHSFHALLFSRDLMRKRFWRVAMRIVVFLALWSGYSSWAAGFFVVVSLIVGPVGAVTGYLTATVFMLELAGVAVSYITEAFFVVAAHRLYQDLTALIAAGAVAIATLEPVPIAAIETSAGPAPLSDMTD